MLAAIQSYVIRHAEVIARVTGLDVEIVDSNLMRIAGTGVYAAGVGQSLEKAGELYREALQSKQTVFVETPREHPLCLRCPARSTCRETLSVSTPILNGNMVLGVIGLVCFDMEGRDRILASQDSYLLFIGLLAEALGHKASDRVQLNNTTKLLDLMLQIVHVNNQGIMVFDDRGGLTYANAIAREQWQLGVDAANLPERVDVRCTGDNLSGFDEFEVSLPGRPPTRLMGQQILLDSTSSSYHSVLVFESPDRLAMQFGRLTAGGGESGLDAIVGDSAAIHQLKSKVQAVAGSSSTVLITGESGTGKELVARAIHRESPRRDGPFVAINCGGIPENLLESELFGYVGGAFTGASRKGHMGKFELAHGGVIFLDEISTMPLYLQVKLLRVIQERTFSRLGSNRRIDVDIRIIAATNQNLQDCIEQMSFRDDLYYRLNVIPLETPALRERCEDVPVLADYFLSKYCALFNKIKPVLSAAVLERLIRYPWPGNVRELEHVVEYAVNMMPDGMPLRTEHLPARMLAASTGQGAVAPLVHALPHSLTATGTAPGITPLLELERAAIAAALIHFGDHTEGKKRAAQALGLSVATLYRKLKIFSK